MWKSANQSRNRTWRREEPGLSPTGLASLPCLNAPTASVNRPSTSPRNSSGVSISTRMIGSSNAISFPHGFLKSDGNAILKPSQMNQLRGKNRRRDLLDIRRDIRLKHLSAWPFDTRFDRRNILLRYYATDDTIVKLKSTARFAGLNLENHVPILTAPPVCL